MARTPSNKKDQLAQDIARAVGAGKAVEVETVDFADPNRPKTCLEVDFPILPINQIAIIEGNAGKPIYQMSKWWARRRSSVFRSMLIAAAMKAPDDPSRAAKVVWDSYYANFQRKGTLKNLKVADIFMGGGTTLVEGSRLGIQMFGNDLNPVAWFVVKQELAKVNLDEVKSLLADIEAEVKPQIMPFYACDGPNGEKGIWTNVSSGRVMGDDFDPLTLTLDQRKEYRYEGPEIIYTFWSKHGPCQVTGCGHRTPIMTSPVVAVKTLTVKHWPHKCRECGERFDIEEKESRMAPNVPFVVAETEAPFAVLDRRKGVTCPFCEKTEMVRLAKGVNKKVELSLIIHPQWLAGAPKTDVDGNHYGGAAQDDAESTNRWNKERAKQIRLLEVRGKLPDEVTCPETQVTIKTTNAGGTVPRRSHYTCASCGTAQDVLTTVKSSGKAAPMAGYAIQGYTPNERANDDSYNGRFFATFNEALARQYDAAGAEWEKRKTGDLAAYWPVSAIPIGAEIGPHDVEGHHFTHWWTMFNPRQLLVHTQLLKAIVTLGDFSKESREHVLAAFQQYLRNQNMFCFWNMNADKMEPHYSRNSFHPKSTVIENCVFGRLGRGNWTSCFEGIVEGMEWAINPWELVNLEQLSRTHPDLAKSGTGKSEKAFPGDPTLGGSVFQGSSTDLSQFSNGSFDLVITDPPFGDLVQYSELSDFFHVWLRLVFTEHYPEIFSGEYTPKTLEAVANRFREPEDPNGFYQRLLSECWREANRILKPGGILAFTFHHSEDDPWVAVLESLFDAGFYLEATYPIRSDESKGDGQFGSQKLEYDIIHVCRKRTEEPKPVSWGRMRREVLEDVRQLQQILENHAKEGLPAADLQVIRRGKALEYFSRHYGKVYVDEERTISVKDALVGINLLLDEGSNPAMEPPPVNAEPMTRQFLRVFDGKAEIARDQMQKFLRGTGMAPDEFVARDWCREEHKIFHMTSPLPLAQAWIGRHRTKLTYDYDQAMYLIGACFEGSGINASDTLKNENFNPHPALKSLLDWHTRRGATQQVRTAAQRALTIYNTWAATHRERARQLELFGEE
jgi:adenine-specific DNA methylase